MSLPPMPPSMKKMPPMPPSMKKALPMPPSMKTPVGAGMPAPQAQHQPQQQPPPPGAGVGAGAAPVPPPSFAPPQQQQQYPPASSAQRSLPPGPPYAASPQQHQQPPYHMGQTNHGTGAENPSHNHNNMPYHHQHHAPSAPGGGYPGSYSPHHIPPPPPPPQGGGGGPYTPSYGGGYPMSSSGAPPPPPGMMGHSNAAGPQPGYIGGGSGRGGGGYPMRGRGGRGGGYFGPRGGGGSFGEDRPLRDATNTVWAGNLDPSAHTDDVLRGTFSEFGVVMRIAKHMEHSYCFIHFRHVEEAQRAVNTLRERGTLGQARFNYGKMFEYTEEEMQPDYRPPDPAERAGAGGYGRRPREEGGGGADGYGDDGSGRPPPSRRSKHEVQMEPSNVLWVGSLPEFISDEQLERHFSVCGTVKFVSRMERGNMAFVHFTTVEECTLALETMKGKRIDGNVMLALNYGHPQRPKSADPTAVSSSPGGGPSSGYGGADGSSNEVATNVVYLGVIPPNASDEDIDAVFTPFEGFIFAKYVSSSGIGFGHFDTVEHAKAARMALQNATVCGVPIRVSFGKNNHSFTMADKNGGGGGVDLDALMRDPSSSSGAAPLQGSSALTLVNHTNGNGGQLVLPDMGNDYKQQGGAGSNSANFLKERAAPELNLRARLQSVMGSTYNGCGAAGSELTPTQIEAICFMVDQCVDEEHAAQLDNTLSLYLPSKAVHVLNVMTKRVREYYTSDPIRKLHVFYSAVKMVLKRAHQVVMGGGAGGSGDGSVEEANLHHEGKEVYTSASLNALLMLLLATSERQSRAGVDRLITIMDALEQHIALLERYSNISETYKEEFRAQLKEIRASAEAEQDLSSLLSSRRRRKAN